MNSTRRRSGALAALACVGFLGGCRGPRPGAVPAPPGGRGGVMHAAPSPAILRLRSDLTDIIRTPALASTTWGIVIRSLRDNQLLYELDGKKLLTPASNLKIATLAVAAERLGWDFTYETQVLGIGAIDFGFLDGDLVVRGSGDPSLSIADGEAHQVFRTWADRLKALGVRSLSGRIIGDDDEFDDDAYGSGWMWDDMDQAYSAGIGALQFNRGETLVTVTPGPSEGMAASATLATGASGLQLLNRTTTGDVGSTVRVRTRRLANSTVLEVSGSVPAGGPAVERRVAVDNQTRYFVEELRKALVDNGIEVKGPAVDIDDLHEPPRVQDAMPLMVHRSPPLRTLATTLMQLSQNQYAETLLKTLGARAGTPTFEGGRRVVEAVLTSWGLDTRQLALADGSGLSRYDLISAEALVDILAHVARDARLNEPFRASLPVAGQAGMLNTRLTGTVAAGVVQAKTGSMRNVRSISGYARTADGEPVVFSILANNYGVTGADIESVSDAILLEVARFKR